MKRTVEAHGKPMDNFKINRSELKIHLSSRPTTSADHNRRSHLVIHDLRLTQAKDFNQVEGEIKTLSVPAVKNGLQGLL